MQDEGLPVRGRCHLAGAEGSGLTLLASIQAFVSREGKIGDGRIRGEGQGKMAQVACAHERAVRVCALLLLAARSYAPATLKRGWAGGGVKVFYL